MPETFAIMRMKMKLSEEVAAIDYARAVFKYKGQEALEKAREQKSSGSEPAINIDLSDIQPQQTPHQPILRRPKHLLL
jgi:hypothetical protein